MLGVDPVQILGPDVHPGQKWQGDDAPGGMNRQQPEHDADMAVDVGRAGWAGGRVVMDAGPLHVGPVTLGRRVVDRQGDPRQVGDQGLDHLEEQSGGDAAGLLAGCGDGDVAALKLAAQAGGANPTGHRPAAAGQEGAEEQPRQSGGGSEIQAVGEVREPLAWNGVQVRRCHGWLPPG